MTDKELQQLLQAKLTDYSVEVPVGDWEVIANQLPTNVVSMSDDAMQGVLADKMSHASVNVPKRAWYKLRKSLAAQNSSKRVVVPFWIWNVVEGAAVAAVALLMYALPTTKQSVDTIPTATATTPMISEADVQTIEIVTTVGSEQSIADSKSMAKTQLKSSQRLLAQDVDVRENQPIAEMENEPSLKSAIVQTTAENVQTNEEQVVQSQTNDREPISVEEAERLMAEVERQWNESTSDDVVATKRRRAKQKDNEDEKLHRESHVNMGVLASLSPNMSNVLYASSTSLAGANVLSRVSARKSARHDLPFTVGASVGIPLYERLDLQTGLTYSYCHSKFIESNRLSGITTERDQQLHYLGVPLMLSYRIVDRERIKFYTSLGGACEKALMVKNRTQETNVDGALVGDNSSQEYVKGVQGSLTYNVGVAFVFYKGMSLYFEPGFTWYIPSTHYAQPANSRTEHPYNLSITAGVRFNVK